VEGLQQTLLEVQSGGSVEWLVKRRKLTCRRSESDDNYSGISIHLDVELKQVVVCICTGESVCDVVMASQPGVLISVTKILAW
jgi:hypothetical protein